MAEFEIPTAQEFAAITRATAALQAPRLLATQAEYDARRGRVMITLNNGVVVGFLPSALPGLEHATAEDLRMIVVEAGGYGLRVASLDADISVPALLEAQLGSNLMKRAAGRAKASRANGRLGGRPRKLGAG